MYMAGDIKLLPFKDNGNASLDLVMKTCKKKAIVKKKLLPDCSNGLIAGLNLFY